MPVTVYGNVVLKPMDEARNYPRKFDQIPSIRMNEHSARLQSHHTDQYGFHCSFPLSSLAALAETFIYIPDIHHGKVALWPG